MFKHAEFGKHAWIRTSKLKKHAHFKISSQDEVFTRLFLIFSSRDEISSRQKRVNSKRHFTIDRDDFIPGPVSSQDEISRVNTLLVIFLKFTQMQTLQRMFYLEF